jgi:hypothetical protein
VARRGYAFATNFGTGTSNSRGKVIIAHVIEYTLPEWSRRYSELWKGRLPAGGQAIPMTYRIRPDGKQFVVIAAGGKLGTTTWRFTRRLCATLALRGFMVVRARSNSPRRPPLHGPAHIPSSTAAGAKQISGVNPIKIGLTSPNVSYGSSRDSPTRKLRGRFTSVTGHAAAGDKDLPSNEIREIALRPEWEIGAIDGFN